MNRREHAVLSLFYDEGHQELTPSFLAYRMRLRASEATTLLDDLVRQGILDLHIGDDGHISYRLPPGERRRVDQSPRPVTTPPLVRPTYDGASTQEHHSYSGGTDASPGYGFSSQSPFAGQARSNYDGTDGSVGPIRPNYSRGWSVADPISTPTAPPQHHRPPQPPPTEADRQALATYRGPHQHLAIRRAPARRVPVVAAALSLLFPGLGQFYNGEFGKGLLLIFSTAFLAFFLLFWVVWVWSAIDAYMVAEYKNRLRLQQETAPGGLLPDGQNTNTNLPAA